VPPDQQPHRSGEARLAEVSGIVGEEPVDVVQSIH
jgi:hypothetical protein